jgi:2-oxoisovalerate dehydrogenase E2 component (dihydrolipoyl transacylase)
VNDYKLPDVGEGLTEAEIVTWKVKVGDVIKVNDIVVEIETAKSLVELPSPYAGTVQALLVTEGETVAVGTPMIRIGDGVPATPEPGPVDSGEDGDSGEQPKTLVGYGPRKTDATRRPRRGAAAQLQGAFTPGGGEPVPVVESDEPAVPATPAAHTTDPGALRVLAKPPVRKLAKDLGIDLRSVTPSGPDGTVTRQDVTELSGGSGAIAPQRPDKSGRERREPIKGVRKMMAQAMVDSAFTAPHVTEWVTVDVTRTMKYLDKLRANRAFADVKVSPLLVVAKAVCLAMRRTPEINATWDDAAQEVVFKGYVNLGIAAATPRGLVVPNVKDAEAMTLADLGGAINGLTRTAREGKTQPAEMAGGTFTITNVGVFGVDAGTPIINPGESAILCFGAIRKQPWVVSKKGRDKIVPRSITTLALSFDHRLIDGEKGSRFLADVASVLGDPASAILY